MTMTSGEIECNTYFLLGVRFFILGGAAAFVSWAGDITSIVQSAYCRKYVMYPA